MKKVITVLTVVIAFLIFGEIALADPISNPTHFDDTYWYWPSNSSGYTSMDTDIIPIVDGSPDGYYFSAYYWFSGDYPATGGYLGLQTEGSVPTGKIAIFSIWGATSSSGPGYNASGNEGGVYYTSRITYPWVVNNTYDLNISLSSQSAGSNTWTGTITDTTTHTSSLIGNIVVLSARGNLYNTSATFHERYSGPTASCSDMQESEVEFTGLTANNGSVTPSSHTNYPATGTGCASSFATQDISGGIETIIGGQFPTVVSPTPVATPAPVNKTTVTPTKSIAKKQNKLSNKSSALNFKLVGYYTAGIAISIAMIYTGSILFRKTLSRRRLLSTTLGQNTSASSSGIHFPGSTVESTIIYPKIPEVALSAQIPMENQSSPIPNSASLPPTNPSSVTTPKN